jgi:superfamily II DNA or RNA helicase
MAKTYKNIVKRKLLKEIFYQIEFFGKKLWMKAKKPFVLAAGTSAGKTLTSLIQLEIFYSIPENARKLTLIISSSKTVLRDNFAIALEEFNPSFSWYVVTNKKELEEAIKDGYQVIVCLPQTLNKNYKSLPKVTNFILDEAHQWYFKPTIQKIIKQTKPTRQLLLTGTPSRFIAKGDDFEFYFVPVMDLYQNDLVSNIKIEVVSSSYDFKQTDYLSAYGNLKADKTNSPSKSKEAFKMVCDEMVLKLRGRLGNKYLANLRGANKISALFNDLKKTIIFCHSVKQANAFYKELSSMKGLKDMVLLSHSENDSSSEYFEQFRTDSQYKVLVAVDRGKLGYNLPDLFNVVDFSMTQSLDMILQMMGRILRLSDKDNEKIYFKVATKNTAGYFVDLMTAALCLFKMEWYSKFNGKNMGGILIPKVKTTRPKSNGKRIPTNKKTQTQRIATLEELGIPLDLNLFNQSILHSHGDKFSTVAWTTLGEVHKEFFNIGNYTKLENVVSYEIAKAICKKHKIKSSTDYEAFLEKNKKYNLPKWPSITYKNEWKGYGDYLGTGRISDNEKFKYRLSFDEAKKVLKPFNLKNWNEYKIFRNSTEENKLKLPANPGQIYKNDGWISIGDFLGNGKIANQNKIFLPLQKAKKFLKGKNFEIHSWKKYTKSKDFPDFLPKDVYCVYGKDKNWKGLRDLFGTEDNWNGAYKK